MGSGGDYLLVVFYVVHSVYIQGVREKNLQNQSNRTSIKEKRSKTTRGGFLMDSFWGFIRGNPVVYTCSIVQRLHMLHLEERLRTAYLICVCASTRETGIHGKVLIAAFGGPGAPRSLLTHSYPWIVGRKKPF